MTEEEGRAAVVAEARTWIGTPYVSNGMVKGRRGGVDCAMLLLGVYRNVGLVPERFDPRPYPAQWHLHQSAERFLEKLLAFASEVQEPPGREPLPGDVVLFKLGRVYAHGAIVAEWPRLIHAQGNDSVCLIDLAKNTTGKRALALLPQRFFSYWGA